MNTGGGADVFGAWHPQNSVSTASEYSVLQVSSLKIQKAAVYKCHSYHLTFLHWP